jgi:hypothetical protein
MSNQESIVKIWSIAGPAAFLSFLLCAQAASAQSSDAAPPAANNTPLQLQVPAKPVQQAPAPGGDNAIVDAIDSGRNDDESRGPQVHGSFTTGIGVSKGYGTSTMNAADLDISGRTDSGRTYDMQIHLMQTKGPGFDPYGGYYAPRYRGY